MFSENTGTYVKLEETSDCIRIEETSSDAAPTIEENLEQPKEPQEEFKEGHQELLSELKEPEQTPSEPTIIYDPMVAEKTVNKCIVACSVM
jgi:hypothetical protein